MHSTVRELENILYRQSEAKTEEQRKVRLMRLSDNQRERLTRESPLEQPVKGAESWSTPYYPRDIGLYI